MKVVVATVSDTRYLFICIVNVKEINDNNNNNNNNNYGKYLMFFAIEN